VSDKRFRVTKKALDANAVAKIVASADCGAITTFVGIVRDEHGGRRVLWLEYEAYEPLALKAFALIDEEAGQRWPSIALAIHHRIGRLEIGDASVVIAAASPHRPEAFAGMPLRHRADQADRADLETRALRRRRLVDRGSHRRSDG
jgi:molybdopterin synthase catalytic subunit